MSMGGWLTESARRKFRSWQSDEPTAYLRLVERDGRRILQQRWRLTEHLGPEIVGQDWRWEDVPLEEELPENKP